MLCVVPQLPCRLSWPGHQVCSWESHTRSVGTGEAPGGGCSGWDSGTRVPSSRVAEEPCSSGEGSRPRTPQVCRPSQTWPSWRGCWPRSLPRPQGLGGDNVTVGSGLVFSLSSPPPMGGEGHTDLWFYMAARAGVGYSGRQDLSGLTALRGRQSKSPGEGSGL